MSGQAHAKAMAKLQMTLSMSKPVVCANSNRLGVFQYSGTNIGCVSPNGAMNPLAHQMAIRCRGNSAYSRTQGSRNALDQIRHT